MYWNSVSEFLAMGGYAAYVWGAYLVTAVFMIVEPIIVNRRHRRAMSEAMQQATGEESQ